MRYNQSNTQVVQVLISESFLKQALAVEQNQLLIHLRQRGVLPSRASAQVRTVAGIPERVKDLRVVNASSSSIMFAWSPLMGSDKGGGGDMQVEYIVEVVSTEREGSGFAMSFPDMDPFRVENAAVVLRALPANMLFQVRVSAANSAALVGPASAIVSGRTLPTLAQAVAAPDFEYSEGRLTLSWQSLADQQAAGGMPIDSFRIYQRRQDETAFSAILEVPGNGVFNSMIKANISSTSAGYSYEYRVSVVTGAGEDPLSPASPPVLTAAPRRHRPSTPLCVKKASSSGDPAMLLYISS